MAAGIVLQAVIPVFLIALLGFIIGKLKKIDIQPMVDLIIYISAPCLIFSSITQSDVNLADFMTIALAAVSIIIILASLTFLILKLTGSKKTGLYLPMSIGNTAFLGYPVALFAFGMAGLSRAVVFDMMNSLFIFSLGIYIIQHENKIKEVLKVPPVYAVVIGLIFNLFRIKTPGIIFRPIETIGMITVPLALLILGYKLTEIRVSSAKTAFLAASFKIIIGFLAALLIVNLFSITGLARNIIILLAAMPSPVMSMVLCQKYSRNPELVASVVFIGTLMSIISIPLVLLFLSFP
ncbi:AEC family transporter [Candidatus Woesearchaeota archaeon]|nr:AEC family transporter [Candidatus Woesearchaeota archaeon]